MSNGADYQYVLTHLFTQHNKLGGELGEYLHTKMVPDLEKSLAAKTMSKEHDAFLIEIGLLLPMLMFGISLQTMDSRNSWIIHATL